MATSSSRASNRGVRLVAIFVSALVHLLLIALAPLLMHRDGFQPSSLLPPPADDPDTPILVSFFDAAPPPEPATPTPDRVPATSSAPRPAAPPPAAPSSSATPAPFIPATPGVGGDAVVVNPLGPPSAGAEGGGSVADRLRPGATDARLWWMAPKPGEFTPPRLAHEAAEFTPEQMAQLRILWAILDMGDSLTAAEAAQRELTDWTFTDAGGGRWGIADGKIYLGDITLPLPSFSPTPGSPAAQRAWVDAQIERGAAAAAARANMNERIKAIRERLDRERRGTPPDTAGRPR